MPSPYIIAHRDYQSVIVRSANVYVILLLIEGKGTHNFLLLLIDVIKHNRTYSDSSIYICRYAIGRGYVVYTIMERQSTST